MLVEVSHMRVGILFMTIIYTPQLILFHFVPLWILVYGVTSLDRYWLMVLVGRREEERKRKKPLMPHLTSGTRQQTETIQTLSCRSAGKSHEIG